MKYDVFISYSRQDAAIAEELCKALDRAGVNYWIDRNLHGSSNFLSEITQCIKSCKVLVFIASADSAASVFTQKEVLYAIKHNKRIVPYRIGEFHFHNNDELDFVFTNIQWVETPEAVLEALVGLGIQFHKETAAPLEEVKTEQPIPSAKTDVVKPKSRKWAVWGTVIAVVLTLVVALLVKLIAFGHRGDDYVESAGCGLNMQMVYVDGGTFKMGATEEQGITYERDERPVRQVSLAPFYIADSEVTQKQWVKIMGNNPSYHKGSDRPVENVTWFEAKAFCEKLSEITGKKYVLPTEAQWEYAARGGCKAMGFKFSGSNTLSEVAWYDLNSGGHTNPVKQKSPNELGLYDMTGNVYEWCSDWYAYYPSSDQIEPVGAKSGSCRVLRGGSWLYGEHYCRVSFRSNKTPESRESNRGFRVVCIPQR